MNLRVAAMIAAARRRLNDMINRRCDAELQSRSIRRYYARPGARKEPKHG